MLLSLFLLKIIVGKIGTKVEACYCPHKVKRYENWTIVRVGGIFIKKSVTLVKISENKKYQFKEKLYLCRKQTSVINTSMLFANKIRELRESKQMLQRHVSAALDIDNAMYCKIERGDRQAKREQIPLNNLKNSTGKPDFKLVPKANAVGDVWESTQEMKNGHSTPFHVALIDRIISLTNAQIILDPFMGSGTTAGLKRDYVGIELSPDYCQIAA